MLSGRGEDDKGDLDDDNSDDPSFTRVLPPHISNFHREFSQIIDQLSPDDQAALRPVLEKHHDVDVQYSISDINILRSIVQLALRSREHTDGNSFITIFKCYETVLHRRRIDTSKDTFYFKLLVKLCRSDGSTWAEKFNNLIREINASLVSRKRPELNARYKAFLLDLLRRKLQYWRVKAHDRQDRSVALDRAAIKYDNATLASQAFQVWRTKLRVFNAREDALLAFINHNQAKSYFDQWRQYTIRLCASRESAANTFRKRAIFRKWHTKAKKLMLLDARAGHFEHARHATILRQRMRSWAHRMYFRGAQQLYDQNLAKKYLSTWVFALTDIENLAERADRFRREKSLRTVLMSWTQAATQVSGLGDLAAVFERRVLLRRTWLRWTRQLHYANATHELDIVRDLSCVAHALRTWRARAVMAIQADVLYERSLIFRHVNRMRQELRLRIITGIFEKRTKLNVLCTWVLHERAALLSRVNNHKLVARAFTGWKTAAVRRVDHDCKVVKKIYGETNYRVASSALKTWRAKLKAVRDYESTARHHDDVLLKQMVLTRLVSNLQRLKQLESQAMRFGRLNTCKSFLTRWRGHLRLKRDQRLEAVLKDLLSRKRVHMCQTILETWVQRTTEKLDLAILADEFFEESSTKLMLSVLQMWRNRILELAELESAALKFNKSRMISSQFRKWHARKVAYDEIQQRAEAVYDINSLLRAQSVLRRWNMTALQIGILIAKADVFAEKWRNTRTRKIFAHWVDSARDSRRRRRSRRRQHEIDDDNDDEDEIDGDESDSGTITAAGAAVTRSDDSLTYTPTRRRSSARVAFSGLTTRIDVTTPSVERWARLRNSPMYEGRRKLFVTPLTRKENRQDVGRTV
ncbi:Sfi1 spindle body protein-domain-containing protein [Lipomyces kononenkoae]|uniref:Sfi1 spindle body protein-domain-containing protein n=1 Tax=Lipomyces kononenkoae TaxID=34357 RepID=A0ACC3T3J2_LIPKO